MCIKGGVRAKTPTDFFCFLVVTTEFKKCVSRNRICLRVLGHQGLNYQS